MAELQVCAAMSVDPELRPRVAAAVVRLALEVIAEGDTPPADVSLDERTRFSRRRNYALSVTDNVPAFTTKAQWAISCWGGSNLPDLYATGQGAALTDEQIMTTLAAAWAATA